MSEGDLQAGSDGVADSVGVDETDLAAKVELLAEENRRLREKYRRTRQTRYKRTALGMATVGLVALAGAVLFPVVREVLLALSGTGVFAAVLLYALTPERFVAASVGEQAVDAHAATGEEIVTALGLADPRIYLPGEGGRLFVPEREEAGVPEAVDGPFVVEEQHRGVALPASGAGLYREFERNLTGEVADESGTLGDQLADALVDGFELVGAARTDAVGGRITVAVEDSTYGDVSAFDHPVASFLGVAVARAMDAPAAVDVDDGGDRADALVTVRWPAGE